jgi:hypothetical protein
MIGVGPHQMTMADWALLGVLQVGLILGAVIAVALAVRATRSPR